MNYTIFTINNKYKKDGPPFSRRPPRFLWKRLHFQFIGLITTATHVTAIHILNNIIFRNIFKIMLIIMFLFSSLTLPFLFFLALFLFFLALFLFFLALFLVQLTLLFLCC